MLHIIPVSKLNVKFHFSHNDRANIHGTILLMLKGKTSQPVKITYLPSLDVYKNVH